MEIIVNHTGSGEPTPGKIKSAIARVRASPEFERTIDRRRKKKRITFSDRPKIRDMDKDSPTFRPFRRVVNTRIAIFASGRGISQSQIAEEVRQRLAKIVSDII